MSEQRLLSLAEVEERGLRILPLQADPTRPVDTPGTFAPASAGYDPIEGRQREDETLFVDRNGADTDSTPGHTRRNVIIIGAASVLVGAMFIGASRSGNPSHAAADIHSALPSAPQSASLAPGTQRNLQHDLPPSTTTSSQSSVTTPQPANVLLPVTKDFRFTPPPCSSTNIEFQNTDKKNQSIVPAKWDFMDKYGSLDNLDPYYEATGKLAGTLVLKSCLVDMSAIKYLRTTNGTAVFGVDVSKTKISLEDSALKNGIALAGPIATDSKLLKALQAHNPKATMADVGAFHTNLSAYDKTFKAIDMLAFLQSFKVTYQQNVFDNEQQYISKGLLQEVVQRKRDPASVAFVPDATVAPHISYDYNYVSKKDLQGPFQLEPSLDTFSVIVTDPATGKQLTPEVQP